MVENTIQTNGLLIDEEWAEILTKNHFLVGLSLDGPRKMHDAARFDVKGEGTFERLMNTVSILKQYKVDFNILTVVTNETAANASALYKFYQRNKFPYVQLIPCMDEPGRNETNSENSNPYAVTPEAYGKFLCSFFDLWYEDFKRGEIIDVRMFSNLAQMTVGYPPEECGMSGCCNCYFVVEGDGSVYPCDFYCMDEWKLGTVAESFSDLIQGKRAEKFVEDSKFVSEKCRECDYASLCRGAAADGENRLWTESHNLIICVLHIRFFSHMYGSVCTDWGRQLLIQKAGKIYNKNEVLHQAFLYRCRIIYGILQDRCSLYWYNDH